MNSLKFIDEEIKQLEERKENAFKNEYYSIYRECYHKIIALQKIKAELEAWYVVKPSVHHIKEQRCFVIHNLFRNEQYNCIMKGLKSLEVEENERV